MFCTVNIQGDLIAALIINHAHPLCKSHKNLPNNGRAGVGLQNRSTPPSGQSTSTPSPYLTGEGWGGGLL